MSQEVKELKADDECDAKRFAEKMATGDFVAYGHQDTIDRLPRELVENFDITASQFMQVGWLFALRRPTVRDYLDGLINAEAPHFKLNLKWPAHEAVSD